MQILLDLINIYIYYILMAVYNNIYMEWHHLYAPV